MKNHFVALGLAICMVQAGIALAEEAAPQKPVPEDRDEVQRAFRDLNDALTNAREVPSVDHGKPAQFNTAQEQPKGTYEKLELRNANSVEVENEPKAGDPQKASEPEEQTTDTAPPQETGAE